TLRHQSLRQVGELLGTARDLGRVKLAAQRGRLGPVFVGVAEDADGVQASQGEELLKLRDVLRRLAGKPDDEVGQDAGLRAGLPDLVEQRAEPRSVPD